MAVASEVATVWRSLAKHLVFGVAIWFSWGRVWSVTPMLSNSMAPSLVADTEVRDIVLVDHLSWRLRSIRRGDIMHLRFHADGAVRPKHFFKRVAGLPGERLMIRDRQVVINGAPVTEPAAFRTIPYYNDGYASPGAEIEIGPDAWFVLGDNNFDSYDSRFWGAVPASDVSGLAVGIVWPPVRAGRIVPLGDVID